MARLKFRLLLEFEKLNCGSNKWSYLPDLAHFIRHRSDEVGVNLSECIKGTNEVGDCCSCCCI